MKKVLSMAITLIIIALLLTSCNSENLAAEPEWDGERTPFGAQDFFHRDLTIAQADRLFGVPNFIEDDGIPIGHNFRTYGRPHDENGVINLVFLGFGQENGRLVSIDDVGRGFLSIRGIRVGYSVDDLLARFPDNDNEIQFDYEAGYHRVLYGYMPFPFNPNYKHSNGIVFYNCNGYQRTPSQVTFNCEDLNETVHILVNDELLVYSIFWVKPPQ